MAVERESLCSGHRLEQLDELRGELADIHRGGRCERCAGLGECDLQQRRERALQVVDLAQRGFDGLVRRRLERG